MPAPIAESRILEAALAVWREEGYRSATTRKVAHRAGIGEVTIFRRFGAKAALFSAALGFEARRMQDDGIGYTGDLRRDLLGIARAYGRMLDRNAAIIFDFLHVAPQDEELASIAPVPLQAMTQLGWIVARYQLSGELGGQTPFDVLLSLLSPLLLQRMLARAHPGLPLSEDLEAQIDHLLDGLRVRR